jgi:hypothetical protein
MFRYVLVVMFLLGGHANAHQFLPTYPKFEQSFISGVMQTKMELFNKRNDVEHYELSVYDKDWNPIAFASESKLIQVNYLQTKSVNVYIKKEDLVRVTYICTESKHKREGSQNTVISSQICSKVK